MKYCESCGNQLKDNATYCPKCGTHVGENKDNSEVEKRNKSFNDKKLSKGQKIALGIAALFALTGIIGGVNDGMWLAVIVSFLAMAAVIAVFVGAIDKKHAWITAVCAFFAIALAAGASASDEEKGEQTQTQTQQKQEPVKQEQEEVKKSPSFIGTYEVTDKVGCTIRITINEDETATITGVRGEGITYYCTWSDFSYSKAGLGIEFSDERPLLYFKGGNNAGTGVYCFIKDGWFYPSISTAQANNQDWRLPVKKVN